MVGVVKKWAWLVKNFRVLCVCGMHGFAPAPVATTWPESGFESTFGGGSRVNGANDAFMQNQKYYFHPDLLT